MGRTLLRIAVFYALAGIGLGIVMAATSNYAPRSAHAHINLVGWVALAVMGLAYEVYPALTRSILAKAHFWLHNVGLPPMAVGVYLVNTGNGSAEPIAIVGSILVALAFLSFAINVWRNINR